MDTEVLENRTMLQEYLQTASGENLKFLQAVDALEHFMQLNWTGPPQERLPLKDEYVNHTQFAIFAKCRRPDLLFFARRVFSEISCEVFPTVVVWRGRVAFALQRVLEEANDRGAGHDWNLMSACVKDLAIWLRVQGVLSESDLVAVLAVLPKVTPTALAGEELEVVPTTTSHPCKLSRDRQTLLICELATRLAYYNKLGPAIDRLLELASSLAGFRFEVTGVDGIRRKYQTETFAQMVCRTTFTEALTAPSTPESGEAPRVVTLEEVEPDTDILEKPVLSGDAGDERELTAAQQAVLISECSRVYYNSVENDALTLETVGALVTRALVLKASQSADWLVFSGSLYWRCRAEHLRTKTRGRSSYQLEALVKQYEEAEPRDRGTFVFALNYPSVWELQRELGERMMEVGMVVTASEQFARLEMWQLAVECLSIAGRRGQALDMLEDLKKKDGALPPLLLCSLADLTSDASLYEQAWERSRGSCARAQRSLGRLAIKAGDWQKAAEHFESALAVAPLHADIWFSLGAAYLRLEDERNAARAFVRCLGINEDEWQAWANLSAVYSRSQGMMVQAKTAAMEAVKRNKNNFKLWENVSVIAMCLDDLQTACTAERHLTLSLRREDRPDLAVLRRLFLEARSRKVKEPGFFRRVFELLKDLTDAGFIKAEKQWRICAMCARLASLEEPDLALDLAFRAIRLTSDSVDCEGVQDALDLIDELTDDRKPPCSAALVMTVKTLPRRLAALGVRDVSEVERLCASIRSKVESATSIPEE